MSSVSQKTKQYIKDNNLHTMKEIENLIGWRPRKSLLEALEVKNCSPDKALFLFNQSDFDKIIDYNKNLDPNIAKSTQICKTVTKYRYGKDFIFQTQLYREKAEKTKIAKYGSLENCKKQAILKCHQTWEEKYGGHPNSRPIFQERMRKAWDEMDIEKRKDIISKREKTNIERYGVSSPFKNTQKIAEATFAKYGYKRFSQTPEHREHMREVGKTNSSKFKPRKIKVFGLKFDSEPEAFLFFYFKNHNIDFEYQIPFQYTDEKGEKATYICDFKIGDRLLEVKNPAFIERNEQGEIIGIHCCYTKGLTEEKIQKRIEHENAKFNFMKSLGVEIIEDWSEYETWCKNNLPWKVEKITKST